MKARDHQSVTLTISAKPHFLPLAVSFAEKSSSAFGFAEPESLALTLATEEIFAYLCMTGKPDREVQLRIFGCGYYVREEFSFEAEGFNMKAFNLTAKPALDQDVDLQETGLLIASRMVDQFQFSLEGDVLCLGLTKEKCYPLLDELALPPVEPLAEFSVSLPDPEELKLLIRLINHYYPRSAIPMNFAFPGKIVDMVACGDYFAAVALDPAGHMGGGILWRPRGSKLVEFSGPYLFNQPAGSSMAQTLIEYCIGAVAKSRAIGLISPFATQELPGQYFELLGSIAVKPEEGPILNRPSYYRHLEEDAGSTVWSHPSLEAFLRSQYERLVFAREIRLIRDEGEFASPYSVLSAQLNRFAGAVMLRPIWWGADSLDNLIAHAHVLQRDGIASIFFEMDLGKPWHCRFTPSLMSSGFEPRLVLPYAGKGDIVVFQHEAGKSNQ